MALSTTHLPLGYWCSLIGQQYFDGLVDRLEHLGIERGFFVLVMVGETNGTLSQQEMADALHLDKVTMVRTLDHLEERGYVMRSDCPGDRRKHHVKLTAKGGPAVVEIRAAYAALNDTAFEGMSPIEIEQLMHHLHRIAGLSNTVRPARPTTKTTS